MLYRYRCPGPLQPLPPPFCMLLPTPVGHILDSHVVQDQRIARLEVTDRTASTVQIKVNVFKEIVRTDSAFMRSGFAFMRAGSAFSLRAYSKVYSIMTRKSNHLHHNVR